MAGFLMLARSRVRAAAAEALSVQHAAFHGKPQDLKKAIKDLSE